MEYFGYRNIFFQSEGYAVCRYERCMSVPLCVPDQETDSREHERPISRSEAIYYKQGCSVGYGSGYERP